MIKMLATLTTALLLCFGLKFVADRTNTPFSEIALVYLISSAVVIQQRISDLTKRLS